MSKQNEILATIETFLKDRNGENFQVSLESDLRKDLQADSVESVSYTHLDVYKRQLKSCMFCI